MLHKVPASMTNGKRLLVFEHSEIPDAGIQQPSGAIGKREVSGNGRFLLPY
jgi:hypothetical protein